MMRIRNFMLKVAGKDGFTLDGKISNVYLARLCWQYGWMLIRGLIVSIFSKKISRNIFIGKKVKLYELRYITIGEKTKIHDNVKIDALSINGVKIGNNCVLGRNSIIECTGTISSIGKGITIGNNSSFGNDCFFGAAGGIEVGNDVIAGQYIRFHSENHNYDGIDLLIREQGVTHQGIKIGNNCWIGSGAVFLDGAEIGDGCVVAANAVVSRKFGDNVVVGGVPAKVIKNRKMNE